jgi:hypothetical protein
MNENIDLYENINLVEQPRNLKINLYRHQLASIYKMEELERTKKVIVPNEGYLHYNIEYSTNIGINCDIAGYGKTFSMIGLIVRDKMEWNLNELYYRENLNSKSKGLIVKKIYEVFPKVNTTLILTNQTIISQWYKDLTQNTNLNVGIVSNKKNADNLNAEDYDVVLVSSTMYNRFILRYSDFAFKRFIFDEPGHVKIPSMKKIISNFYWLVTATPDLISNLYGNCRTNFMYDILDGSTNSYYRPSFTESFKYFLIKNDDDFVLQSFSMPLTVNKYYNCYDPLYKLVKGLVNDNLLDMISAGNISGVIKNLGGKETSNIVDLVKQKKLEELEEINAKINIYTIRNDELRLEQWNKNKDKVLKQIDELDNRFKEILESPCIICYNNLINPVMEPKCQNIYCTSCLLNWLKEKNTCPFCRTEINSKDLIYIKQDNYNNNIQNISDNLSKQEQLIKIIKNGKSNSKFIIFSSDDETFNIIRNILNENKFLFGELKGTLNKRNKTIESFKSGKIPILFLNSNYNGSGINLQETTDIIIYHEMPLDIKNQILARANRIGRTIELTVHHLII